MASSCITKVCCYCRRKIGHDLATAKFKSVFSTNTSEYRKNFEYFWNIASVNGWAWDTRPLRCMYVLLGQDEEIHWTWYKICILPFKLNDVFCTILYKTSWCTRWVIVNCRSLHITINYDWDRDILGKWSQYRAYGYENRLLVLPGDRVAWFWLRRVNGKTGHCVPWRRIQLPAPPQCEELLNMMTSSNGNIFRVTGHLCGEFTGPQWIPRTKASDAELWCFLWSASE